MVQLIVGVVGTIGNRAAEDHPGYGCADEDEDDCGDAFGHFDALLGLSLKPSAAGKRIACWLLIVKYFVTQSGAASRRHCIK